MKLEGEQRIIESNVDNSNDMSFTIDDESSVIFEILRSKMYSNPVKAICQELTSNARDAHREVGKEDTSIQVWLPGEYLVVKDFGPGISPWRMKNIYRKYGASTKRSDNRQTGGFGLGGKVFFSYVDSAIIETVHDGIKYIYNAYLDETNRGSIKLFSSCPTDDPAGTAIKVPVKSPDRYAFQQALRASTLFWEVQPDIVGGIKGEVLTPTISTDRWAIYSKNTNGYNVIVDEIPYQDSTYSVPQRIVLKFQTGEVDLTATRETLHDSPKTRKAIEDALQNYRDTVCDQVKDQIDKCETFYECIQAIEVLPNLGPAKWEWRGKTFEYPLNHSVPKFSQGGYKTKLSVCRVNKFDYRSNDANFILLDKDDYNMYDRQRINFYMKNNNISYIYLVKDGVVPLDNLTPLTSIKITRGKTVSGKRVKTYINARNVNRHKNEKLEIDRDDLAVYLKEGEETGYVSLSKLPANVYIIPEKEMKHVLIQDPEIWVSLEEYLKNDFYDHVNETEIQEVANYIVGKDTYDYLTELSAEVKELSFLENKHPKIHDSYSCFIEFLIDNKKISVILPDVYKKYPLLKALSYQIRYYKEDVLNYIKLIDNNKEGESHE